MFIKLSWFLSYSWQWNYFKVEFIATFLFIWNDSFLLIDLWDETQTMSKSKKKVDGSSSERRKKPLSVSGTEWKIYECVLSNVGLK